jgi:AcrR family transcriptional regulator
VALGVNPRPYQPVERQRAVDDGREKIVRAAAEILESDDIDFSIDAVARRAGVARMTVYNQFESKAGLLEALFDSIAERGEFSKMGAVFREPDSLLALDAFVALFGRFWTQNRSTHRRLRSAALRDPDLAAAIASRNERRRQGLAKLLRRFGADRHSPIPDREVVNVLFVLLSFDSFDALAGPDRTPEDVTPIVQTLARMVMGVTP